MVAAIVTFFLPNLRLKFNEIRSMHDHPLLDLLIKIPWELPAALFPTDDNSHRRR